MEATAVLLREPEHVLLSVLSLTPPGNGDIVVDVEWSGISAGTERLLWSGQMPSFPGMGYPLVPGYESVGRVVEAGGQSGHRAGQRVFVPGARCFSDAHSLFGATASRLVVSGQRAIAVDESLRENAALLALAATAHHAISMPGACKPDRIVGHGVLGRLLARIAIATGGEPPVVWERNPLRRTGAHGYEVIDPGEDAARDHHAIFDVSGDSSLLDALIGRLARGGEIVLAGFYSTPLAFSFPPAFMREARIRIAAEWRPSDLETVKRLVESGHLSLEGLITHREDAKRAAAAYRTAFDDPECLKMVLGWSGCR
jgi:3-hydroxyethyl bacteriochlorophyllide a dehydrogenase